MSSTTKPLTLAQRLSFFLAIDEAKAKLALRSNGSGLDLDKIASNVNLKKEKIIWLFNKRENLENYRVNPNQITRSQLKRIPNLEEEQIKVLEKGRPYFSLNELEAVSKLPRIVLEQLFFIAPFELTDKITGKSKTFEPIFDQFILQPKDEFESPDKLSNLGYTAIKTGKKALIRVIVPRSFEEDLSPNELKKTFNGMVFPVLKDNEGFTRYFLPGTIDLWFSRDTPKERILSIISDLGLVVKGGHFKVGFYIVELQQWPKDFDITHAVIEKIKAINQYEEIRFAEPSEVGYEDFQPNREVNVTEFEDATTQPRNWNYKLIELSKAHQVTKGAPNVTTFIIDSGMKMNHPDLENALRPDWDSLDLNFDIDVPEAEKSPSELEIAHGTGVASVVGGQARNATIGIQGISPECWVLPVKISGLPFSQSYGLRASAILEVIDYIEADQRGVINISWSTNGENIGIREALVNASTANIPIVTSAGNFRPDETPIADKLHYPSRYAFGENDSEADLADHRKIKGLCSVASINANIKKASYSYFGENSITISAPGGEAGSAGVGIFLASTPHNYSYNAGTSFAAPHVAGLISLLLSLDPQLNAQDTIDIIKETATEIDFLNPSYENMLGAGMINAGAALTELKRRLGHNGNGDGKEPKVVNINTATVAELSSALPLLGEWYATRIVDYRQTHGLFSETRDLVTVGILDNWAFQQIEALISVDS